MGFRNLLILAAGALMIASCDSVPSCAIGGECKTVYEPLSEDATKGEPHAVRRLSNRAEAGEYYQIQQVLSPYHYPKGTLIIDTPKRVLYLMEDKGLARRYPIAIGREGYSFAGHAEIGRKVRWPQWRPTPDMVSKDPSLPEVFEGGANNPLGARSLYLYVDGRDTLYRIHGTSDPRSIGKSASSGCIRMFNEDVIDLFNRVPKGSPVVVLGKTGAPDEKIDIINDKEIVQEVDDPIFDIFTGRYNPFGTQSAPAPAAEKEESGDEAS